MYFPIFALVLLQIAPNMAEDDANWPSSRPHWQSPFISENLIANNRFEDAQRVTVRQVEDITENLPVKFPLDNVKYKTFKNKYDDLELENHINEAYPLIHETSLRLMVSFLSHKKRFGSTLIERNLYQNLTLVEFIDRLLTKRAVTFYGAEDNYCLRDGTKGASNWESIGKDNETNPLIFQNYLTYDELKLSSLLCVSSPSYFNLKSDTVEEDGIVFGGIGARLNRPLVMEYNEIIKSKEQNNHLHGFGQFALPTLQGIFINYYGDASLTYEEMQRADTFENNSRFVKLSENVYFDKINYGKRIALTIDTFLVEANERAAKLGKKAFVYVGEGFGLDEFKISNVQNKLFLDAVLNRTKFLGKVLANISNLYFPSNVFDESVMNCTNGERILIEDHPLGGITMNFGNRTVFDKLTGENEGKLLVVSYNWNSNASPGNELWAGKNQTNQNYEISSSSEILELHNPWINLKIRANSMQVVTLEGMISLKTFIEEQKNKKDE